MLKFIIIFYLKIHLIYSNNLLDILNILYFIY